MPRGADEVLFASIAAGILVFLLLLFVLVRLIRGSNHIPCLVLLEYRVSNQSQEGCYVVLAGRPEGIWAWFLSMIGLGTNVRFEVTKSAVQCDMEGVHWHAIDSVPLKNVGCTTFGYSKRTAYLVIGIFLALGGTQGLLFALMTMRQPDAGMAIAGAAASITIGLLFLLVFLLSKRLVIQVETGSGRVIGVRFKPSIVGGLNVDLEEASNAVGIINSLIAARA